MWNSFSPFTRKPFPVLLLFGGALSMGDLRFAVFTTIESRRAPWKAPGRGGVVMHGIQTD